MAKLKAIKPTWTSRQYPIEEAKRKSPPSKRAVARAEKKKRALRLLEEFYYGKR